VSNSTRRGFLATAASLAGLLVAARGALGARRLAPALRGVSARNLGRRYAGDRALFATVAPGVPGRDTAAIRFQLDRPGGVRIEAVRTALRQATVAWQQELTLGRGSHELTWTPEPGTPVGSYVIRLTTETEDGRRTLGSRRPESIERQRAAVVRVLGIEAAFGRRSYVGGEPMQLTVLADAPSLTLQFLRSGSEVESTDRGDEIKGVPFGEPAELDWTGKRSGSVTIEVQSGDWPTGVGGWHWSSTGRAARWRGIWPGKASPSPEATSFPNASVRPS
jgi:hypothetical protein